MIPLPVEKNIRYRGLSTPQPFNVGIPAVLPGDWMAERPAPGRPARLVYYRTPWTAGPYVRTPAVPLPAGLGMVDQAISTVGTLIGQAQQSIEQRVAEQAADSMMERLQPYLVWGAVGLAGVGILGALVGFSLGRDA